MTIVWGRDGSIVVHPNVTYCNVARISVEWTVEFVMICPCAAMTMRVGASTSIAMVPVVRRARSVMEVHVVKGNAMTSNAVWMGVGESAESVLLDSNVRQTLIASVCMKSAGQIVARRDPSVPRLDVVCRIAKTRSAGRNSVERRVVFAA